MVLLSDRASGALLGEISKADFTVMQEILEEESQDDVDYYIQEATLELLSQAGLSPEAHLLLTKALGEHADLELGWEVRLESDTGLVGRILGPTGALPGLMIEARAHEQRFWTFTREDGTFELLLPSLDASYHLRLAAIGDRELGAESIDIEANRITKLEDFTVELVLEPS